MTVLGIAATRTTFDFSSGAEAKYVDPATLVYSHTDSPYFDDIYYIGEVKDLPINELVKEFPELTESDIKELVDKRHYPYNYNNNDDKNKVQLI